MSERISDLNRRIALRVRDLRRERGLSLEALAARSGVSRSMISVVERGESSPTAVLLEKLAAGLGVMLATLFDPAPDTAPPGPLVRRVQQPVWRDPDSGYVRRNLSPPGERQPVQLVEVQFPGGGRVAFDTGARDRRVHQQVWMVKGTMEITHGGARHLLREGDCLAMLLDQPTLFRNPTRRPARYLVAIAREGVTL